MKKAWLILVSFLLLWTMAACGNSAGNSNSASDTANSGSSPAASDSASKDDGKAKEPVKLMFWGAVPEEAGPKEVVDNWNAANPDIQVEYVRYVNDDTGNLKLDTALLTGQGVDLFISYTLPRLTQRVNAGHAVNLGEYQSDYNIESKMGDGAKDWQIDGKYYAIPTKINKHFYWINKDLLDKAQLPLPYDWTWDDLKEYAKTLNAPKQWGFLQNIVNNTDDATDGSMIGEGYTKADGTSNMDNPYFRKHMELLYEMMHNDKTTPALAEQLTSKMPTEAMFLGGEAAIYNAGEWIFRYSNDLKTYPRNFKIAFAPSPRLMADQKDYRIYGGLGDAVSINSKSEHQEEAWKFLKWYADGGMLPMAKGGRVPASKEVDREEAVKLLLFGAEDTYDVESLKKVFFSDAPTFVQSLDQPVIDLRKEEYEKYFLKAQSLDETVANIVKRHNEFLKTKK